MGRKRKSGDNGNRGNTKPKSRRTSTRLANAAASNNPSVKASENLDVQHHGGTVNMPPLALQGPEYPVMPPGESRGEFVSPQSQCRPQNRPNVSGPTSVLSAGGALGPATSSWGNSMAPAASAAGISPILGLSDVSVTSSRGPTTAAAPTGARAVGPMSTGQNPTAPAVDAAGISPIGLAQSNNLASVCAPLASHLAQNIRDKIGRSEFVELGSILDTWDPIDVSSPDEQTLSFAIDETGRPVLKPAKKPPKKIISISVWTNAFLVYMATYLEYHPHRTQEMMQYFHTIRMASLKFGSLGWVDYDRHFRMRKQRSPETSWGVIDGELWYLFMVTSPAFTRGRAPQFREPFINYPRQQSQTSGFPATHSSPTMGSPGSFCFDFNKAIGCSFARCKFPHVCGTCRAAGHNALTCKHGKTSTGSRWGSMSH